DQHHKGRQILVLAPQAVTDPGTQTGPSGLLASRLDKRDGGIMVDGFSVYGPDDGDVVHDLGMMGKQFADVSARLPHLVELENGSGYWQGALTRSHPGDMLTTTNGVGQF